MRGRKKWGGEGKYSREGGREEEEEEEEGGGLGSAFLGSLCCWEAARWIVTFPAQIKGLGGENRGWGRRVGG